MATESGIKVCCPVHDALLVEAPLEDLDAAIIQTQEIMAEAGRIVLDGFNLRSEVEIVRYPDRYMDSRGTRMWETIMGIIYEEISSVEGFHGSEEKEFSGFSLVQINNTGETQLITQV